MCRTCFIEITEEEGNRKPSGFYWQPPDRYFMSICFRNWWYRHLNKVYCVGVKTRPDTNSSTMYFFVGMWYLTVLATIPVCIYFRRFFHDISESVGRINSLSCFTVIPTWKRQRMYKLHVREIIWSKKNKLEFLNISTWISPLNCVRQRCWATQTITMLVSSEKCNTYLLSGVMLTEKMQYEPAGARPRLRVSACISTRAVSESPMWPHVLTHIFVYKSMQNSSGLTVYRLSSKSLPYERGFRTNTSKRCVIYVVLQSIEATLSIFCHGVSSTEFIIIRD